MVTPKISSLPAQVVSNDKNVVDSHPPLELNNLERSENRTLSELLPEARAIPKTPSFFLVYRIAPGYKSVSVTFEYNHNAQFLNSVA